MEMPLVNPESQSRRPALEKALWILLGTVVSCVLAVGVLILLMLVWITRSFGETLLATLLLAGLLAYGAWKLRRARAVLLVGLLALVATIGLRLAIPDGAVYGKHFNEWRFFLASKGMSRAEVQRLLGDPAMEEWRYQEDPWMAVFFFEGKVSNTNQGQPAPSPLDRVVAGMTAQQVRNIAGAPRQVYLQYIWSDSSHPVRMLELRDGVVTSKAAYFDLD
jgi:outer membrane protein assembly factor BamE (lipoprotein component of BamABCDE complex)